MKKANSILLVLLAVAIVLPITINSCKKDEERPATTISLDKTETGPHDIGETVTAVVTIVANDVKAFTYTKVVDGESGDAVDAMSSLSQSGNTYTYNFSYELMVGDDVGTLGYEFEVTDELDVSKTAAILITTNLSVPGMFIKYDWTITGEDHPVWGDLLAPHDAAKTFRFHKDGTYDVDLSVEHAGANHHFCYWVYKETPSNGDTLAVLRLIRRLKSGDTALDENYDFRITAATESEMTMYWDIAVWAIFDIERTFKSQAKGAFQPYGTAAYADSCSVETWPSFDCALVDDDLLVID